MDSGDESLVGHIFCPFFIWVTCFFDIELWALFVDSGDESLVGHIASPSLEVVSSFLFLVSSAVQKLLNSIRSHLNNRHFCLPITKGKKFKIKVVSAEASLLALYTAAFSLRPHVVFPRNTRTPGSPCVSIQISSSSKDTSCPGFSPLLTVSFELNRLFKGPCHQMHGHIPRHWGLGP